MAKEKATKETTDDTTFYCKFCDESKPLSEMTFMTRFFPVLVACRNCEKTLQSLKVEDEDLEESLEESAEETLEEEAPSETESEP